MVESVFYHRYLMDLDAKTIQNSSNTSKDNFERTKM